MASRKAPRRKPVRSGEFAYAGVFERAAEGGYVVHFPAFGMATQGETLAEARAMAADCLEGRIASMLESGEELPPSDVAAELPRIEVVRVRPKAA
jgi:predicted RNase H-like HicB family nuclease